MKGLPDVGVERAGSSQNEGEDESSDQIRYQHHGPQPGDVQQGRAAGPGQQGNDAGERVLGEELLPCEDDYQEAERVAEFRNQGAPRLLGQVRP